MRPIDRSVDLSVRRSATRSYALRSRRFPPVHSGIPASEASTRHYARRRATEEPRFARAFPRDSRFCRPEGELALCARPSECTYDANPRDRPINQASLLARQSFAIAIGSEGTLFDNSAQLRSYRDKPWRVRVYTHLILFFRFLAYGNFAISEV